MSYRSRKEAEDTFKALTQAPWWISAVLLVAGNIFLLLIVPAIFGGSEKGALGPAVMKSLITAFTKPIAVFMSIALTCTMIWSFIREKLDKNKNSNNSKVINFDNRAPKYRSKKTFFTEAERNFLKELELVISKDYRVFGQVRLADIITLEPNLSSRENQAALNKITGKHVDFLICNAKTFDIEAAIELDDRSHEMQHRIDRDIFLESALASANLPLVRFKTQKVYDQKELYEKLRKFTDQNTRFTNEAINQNCKNCGNEMIARKRGDKNFWVCKMFPDCRNVIPV